MDSLAYWMARGWDWTVNHLTEIASALFLAIMAAAVLAVAFGHVLQWLSAIRQARKERRIAQAAPITEPIMLSNPVMDEFERIAAAAWRGERI